MKEPYNEKAKESRPKHSRFAKANKILADNWSMMTDEEKEPYNEKAKESRPKKRGYPERTPLENIYLSATVRVRYYFRNLRYFKDLHTILLVLYYLNTTPLFLYNFSPLSHC